MTALFFVVVVLGWCGLVHALLTGGDA